MRVRICDPFVCLIGANLAVLIIVVVVVVLHNECSRLPEETRVQFDLALFVDSTLTILYFTLLRRSRLKNGNAVQK